MVQVLVADTDILLHPVAETWAELVHLVQKQGSYSHIISASNSFGKNVLPRAAALLDVSPVTDVIEISEPRLFTRYTFGYSLVNADLVNLCVCFL